MTNISISHYRYHAMLVALTLAMVIVIESNHPYFFLQDDNRTLYLPLFVHNLRALLGGEFPFYNFHQYLGTPVTIQYAVLYPINYFALFLSKLLLGNYFATMEFIAAFHLIVAALGFFCLMRFFELEKVSCFFGAIAWTFCGFVIVAGNSWIHIVGFAAYLPWILLFSIRLVYRFDVGCFLVLVFIKVCDMLLGNPQLFLYMMTFELLTVVLFSVAGKKSGTDTIDPVTGECATFTPRSFIKILSTFIANYAVVFIITLPLIVQVLQQASVSANRRQLLAWNEYAAFSYNLKYWLHGLLAPFKTVDITTQFELHFISHIGYLTLVFLLLAILRVSRISFKPIEPHVNRAGNKQILVFLLLAVFSLLWAGDIFVARIFYHLPVYNRLRIPFKVAFFTSFYLIIIATYGFDIYCRKIRSARVISQNSAMMIFAVILFFHTVNFLILYAALPQQMFSRHLDPVPLAEPLREKLAAGRIVSASLDDVLDGEKIVPGFSAPLLGFDYATLWGLFHFGGYDPLVSEKAQAAAFGIKNNPVFNLPADEPFNMPPETLEYFRKWGVKWYVVNKAIPLSGKSVFTLAYSDEHRNVLFDPLAKPLVYWQSDPYNVSKLHYVFSSNSVKIDYESDTGGNVIINVLQHLFFSAQLDGKALSINETDDNQVSLYVPGGKHRIILKYIDRSFIHAAIVSAAFIVLLIPLLIMKNVRNEIMKVFS